jgi:hypothetical protein
MQAAVRIISASLAGLALPAIVPPAAALLGGAPVQDLRDVRGFFVPARLANLSRRYRDRFEAVAPVKA